MGVTCNTPGVVTSLAEFLALPEADEDPMLRIARNVNGFYEAHAPNLLVACYTCEADIAGRSAVFRIPILPSADGLTYDFDHWVYTALAGGDLTVLVEEWTGAAWATIRSSTFASAAAATNTVAHSDVISAAATMLRITISRASGDAFTPESIHVRPGTNSPVTGTYGSGFVPYEDTMLRTAGAGLNTEHLNRPVQNAMAILTDRKQCVFTFVQEDNLTNCLYKWSDGSQPDGWEVYVGEATASIPWQDDPDLTVLVIATVDAGATADLVTVYQTAYMGPPVTLDASDGVESGTMHAHLLAPLTLGAHMHLGVYSQNTTGNDSAVLACVVYWTPGD